MLIYIEKRKSREKNRGFGYPMLEPQTKFIPIPSTPWSLSLRWVEGLIKSIIPRRRKPSQLSSFRGASYIKSKNVTSRYTALLLLWSSSGHLIYNGCRRTVSISINVVSRFTYLATSGSAATAWQPVFAAVAGAATASITVGVRSTARHLARHITQFAYFSLCKQIWLCLL